MLSVNPQPQDKMRSYIITGDKESRDEFVSSFIKKEQIPTHSISYFDEEIKIEGAKLLRQILSKKYSGKNLIVLQELNLIAQNALLKSIEEISENISIIISVSDLSGILDTVKSRLFLIELAQNREFDGVGFEALLNENISEKFQFVDNFLSSKAELVPIDVFDNFVSEYRKTFFNYLKELDKSQIKYQLSVLKKLLSIANLVKSNNVNLRFALESVLF
jgi:hypothetical protein